MKKETKKKCTTIKGKCRIGTFSYELKLHKIKYIYKVYYLQ